MNVLRPEHMSDEVNHALGLWCSDEIGLARPFEDFASLGIFDDGGLKAVVIYHNWHPEDGVIEMSSAGRGSRWMTRPVLFEMFCWPFERRGCQMVVLRVSERNQTQDGRGMVRIARAYGFAECFIPRLRGRDEGEFIFTLTDDAWRSNGFHKEHANG